MGGMVKLFIKVYVGAPITFIYGGGVWFQKWRHGELCSLTASEMFEDEYEGACIVLMHDGDGGDLCVHWALSNIRRRW